MTDCSSLHECVIRQSLPEDERAAIEVLAIREMVTKADEATSDGELEEDLRLKERDLRSVYHWTCFEDMKADLLTKKSDRRAREQWHKEVAWIALRTLKKCDILAQKAVPSRPRSKLDLHIAREVIEDRLREAIEAGFIDGV